jgi:Fur family ferric uptake transcriptional regulator
MRRQPDDILRSFHLKKTRGRKDILELFLRENSRALSEVDIEQVLGDDMDRVTIYRTLHTFQDNGIVHRITGSDGITRFALCGDACLEHDHHVHDHVHFQCERCRKTECLDHQLVAHIDLPDGYLFSSSNFLIVGTCKDCNTTIS